MKAQVLHRPAPVSDNPLLLEDIPQPEPGSGELLVRVRACGVCHTDLHVAEGDLTEAALPIVPGHEVVGLVEATGDQVSRFQAGDRVGIPWLHWTDDTCDFCQSGQENLCPQARFTGYTANGGYAEYLTVPADFAVPIPDFYTDDAEAAPLLCAGIVGYRSLRLSEIRPGGALGLYGFGASAHLCIQVATYWGCDVYVFTRSEGGKQHALELGAVWVGDAQDTPPVKLDSGIIFAPAGWIVPYALGHLRGGGTLAFNAIHASPIPEFSFDLLWQERTIRSVANATRQDAEEFLPLAAEIGIRPDITRYPLEAANDVLKALKASDIRGAAVLEP